MNDAGDQGTNEDSLALKPGADAAPGDDELALPTGRPEQFGLQYETASIEKRRVWDCQEAFLATYRTCRRVDRSAAAIGVTRWAHDNWMRADTFGYRERLKSAHADWREEHIEGEIDSRIKDPKGNRGSDVLVMFRAKAEDRLKYGDSVQVLDSRDTKDLLDELRRAGEARPAVIDGTSHVVEPTDDEGPQK